MWIVSTILACIFLFSPIVLFFFVGSIPNLKHLVVYWMISLCQLSPIQILFYFYKSPFSHWILVFVVVWSDVICSLHWLVFPEMKYPVQRYISIHFGYICFSHHIFVIVEKRFCEQWRNDARAFMLNGGFFIFSMLPLRIASMLLGAVTLSGWDRVVFVKS